MKSAMIALVAAMGMMGIGCAREARVNQIPNSSYYQVEVDPGGQPESLKESLCSAARQGYRSVFYNVQISADGSCSVPVLDNEIQVNRQIKETWNRWMSLQGKVGNYR